MNYRVSRNKLVCFHTPTALVNELLKNEMKNKFSIWKPLKVENTMF